MDDQTRTLDGDAGSPPRPSAEAPTHWGPFEIRHRVGQGGFGEVYKAFDTTLQRDVALKLLKARGQDGEEESRAVLREARLLARVRHPNVVPVYGVDTHDGRVGFWSDFVEGKTLSTVLALQGPFSAHEAVSIGIDLAKAVGAVHSAGLLHRDIKAANVMREVGGRILLMDFGLTHGQEESGLYGGTPPYMAPELMAGEPANASTDIYALGILLYHLLTGKYPSSGTSFEAVKESFALSGASRRRLLDDRPDVPPPLARVVETACHLDPRQRYQSAGELIAALSDSHAGGGSVSVSQAPAALGQLSASPRRRWRSWMLAPIAAALILIGYVTMMRPSEPGWTAGRATHTTYLKAQDHLDHYYRPHGIEKAIALFQQTIVEDPRFALAYAGLARANFLQYWQMRDPKYVEPARAAADKALSLDRNLASVHVTLGMLYTQTGRKDLASQELNEALKLDANNAEAYYAQAELLYNQGRIGEVEAALQRAIGMGPLDWRFAHEMAFHYLRTGDLEKAIKWSRQAVELTPDNPRALTNLGLAYRRAGRLTEAIATYQKAIAIEPGFNRYSGLGVALQEQGQFSDAVEAYRQAIALNKTGYQAWGNLGGAYAQMDGKSAQSVQAFGEAIRLAEELRRQRPNDPVLVSALGFYYASVGNKTRSLPLLRQAGLLASEDPTILLRLAEASEVLGLRADALDWLAKALAHGVSLSSVDRSPDLARLRDDPRIRKLRSNVEIVSQKH